MEEPEEKIDKQFKDVRNWIWINTIIISISLALFALIWQQGPDQGKITVTFLLFLSFPLLINSITANSKSYKIACSDKPDEKKIKTMMVLAEYSYSIGFTLILSGLAILGYEYLMDYTSGNPIALWFPVFFFVLAWILLIAYTIVDFWYDVRRLKEEEEESSSKDYKKILKDHKKILIRKIFKKFISILGEAICLYFIFLDYNTIFMIY